MITTILKTIGIFPCLISNGLILIREIKNNTFDMNHPSANTFKASQSNRSPKAFVTQILTKATAPIQNKSHRKACVVFAACG